jgi:hypothetical protein
MDFDLKRDCYIEGVRNYMKEIEIVRNAKGELIDQVEKTPEEQAEIDFKNQVYERIFKKMEEADEFKRDSDEDSDDSTIRVRGDRRDEWIQQQKYI